MSMRSGPEKSSLRGAEGWILNPQVLNFGKDSPTDGSSTTLASRRSADPGDGQCQLWPVWTKAKLFCSSKTPRDLHSIRDSRECPLIMSMDFPMEIGSESDLKYKNEVFPIHLSWWINIHIAGREPGAGWGGGGGRVSMKQHSRILYRWTLRAHLFHPPTRETQKGM